MLRDHWTEVDETGHAHSVSWGTKLLGSGILILAPALRGRVDTPSGVILLLAYLLQLFQKGKLPITEIDR